MSRYANKRLRFRTSGGRFRKAQMADVGFGGVCPTCSHLLIRHFDGDPRDANPNPRRFRFRCFTCEPETAEEQALSAEVEKSRPKPPGILDILREAGDKPDDSTP